MLLRNQAGRQTSRGCVSLTGGQIFSLALLTHAWVKVVGAGPSERVVGRGPGKEGHKDRAATAPCCRELSRAVTFPSDTERTASQRETRAPSLPVTRCQKQTRCRRWAAPSLRADGRGWAISGSSSRVKREAATGPGGWTGCHQPTRVHAAPELGTGWKFGPLPEGS